MMLIAIFERFGVHAFVRAQVTDPVQFVVPKSLMIWTA